MNNPTAGSPSHCLLVAVLGSGPVRDGRGLMSRGVNRSNCCDSRSGVVGEEELRWLIVQYR